MKLFRTFILLSVMLVGGMAFGMNVKTDYDRSFDFGRLRTFAFETQNRPNKNFDHVNTLVDSRIRNALIKDLEARGFRYRPDGPADFLVAYYARQRERE